MIYKLFPHWDQKCNQQGQGFQILPSLWGHFIPIAPLMVCHGTKTFGWLLLLFFCHPP